MLEHPLYPILAVVLFNFVVCGLVIAYINRIHKRTVSQIRSSLPERNGTGRLERIRELTESLEGEPPPLDNKDFQCPDSVASMIERCEPTVVKFDGKLEDIYVLVVHKDC
jgi:hypothetical protein